MPSIVPLAVRSAFAGRFRVVRVLGSGRLGSTYVADPLPSGDPCALKVMGVGKELAREARESYPAETARAARLLSPHLVRTFGAGLDEATGQAWLASELLPGQSLATRIHLWGRVPLEEVRLLVGALGEALGAAHAAGLSHHALTPQKVHLLQDADRTVKLRDLGASRLLARALAPGAIGASPIWAALEQLVDPGADVTPAANVWSLGLLAFHALTGRPYWMQASVEGQTKALLSEMLSEPLVRASERAAALGCEEGTVPAWFDGWFARCVARDPAERWKDAREARADWAARDEAAEDDARLTIPLVVKEDEARPTLPLVRRELATSPTPPPTTTGREPLPVADAPTRDPVSRTVGYGPMAALAGLGVLVALWMANAWRGAPADGSPGAGAQPPVSAEEPLSSARELAPVPPSTAGVGADGLTDYSLDDVLKALNKVYYGDCTVPAPGKLLVQFAPTGQVMKVTVQEGDYDDATASCLAARFRAARVAPFRGKPHYVTASVVATKPSPDVDPGAHLP